MGIVFDKHLRRYCALGLGIDDYCSPRGEGREKVNADKYPFGYEDVYPFLPTSTPNLGNIISVDIPSRYCTNYSDSMIKPIRNNNNSHGL